MKHGSLLVLALAATACGVTHSSKVQPLSSSSAWLPVGSSAGHQQADQSSRGGLSHKPKVVASVPSGPVTEEEARTVFARTDQLFREVAGASNSVGPIQIPSSSRPAKRGELIREMARLYRLAEPKFKLTPRPVKLNAKVIHVDASERSSAEALIRCGALANYGPLAAGPDDTVTVVQFGDAVGFFIARIAEMTHMPSSKWSPVLKDSIN